MTTNSKLLRGFSALTVATASFALSGCSDSAEILRGPTPVHEYFQSYVALGNSITAGFQSSGINDATQRESYVRLLAIQMNTRYAYPSLAGTGCPAPITTLGAPPNTGCEYRAPSSVSPSLNNLGVPGAKLMDLLYASTPQSNPLSLFILGGKSPLDKARDANPTFMSIWIGNNDILEAAVSGQPAGATPVATFERQFDSVATVLNGMTSLKGGVLIGVVNVLNVPVLFNASQLFVAGFRAQFEEAVGRSVTVDPMCLTNGALLSFAIIPRIRSGEHPAIISCTKNPATPVGDLFILDTMEQREVNEIITAYNSKIQSIASARNWAYWDPNPALIELRNSGCINVVPNMTSPNPFGECISLDGIHPSGRAHIEIANGVIRAINAHYELPPSSVLTTTSRNR